MIETLSEKELEFLEHWSDPTSLTENLIPENFNAPQTWNEDCKTIFLRPYQMSMQNYSYMYAHDPELSDKVNFRIKKGAGDSYHIGARDTGKSFLLKIDALLTILHRITEGCLASFDAKHLRNVTQPIASYVESHSFFEIFHLRDSRKKTVSRDPLTVTTEHGSLLKGVNEKVSGNNPGVGFHALHYEWLGYEECSYMSEEGTKKRIDSGSSLGHIERLSGIPDLRIGSPLTKLLQDDKKKNWIWRLPQYCIAEGSKILMSDCSFKNIENVQIGEEIITVSEETPFRILKAQVTNKIYNGIEDTVTIQNDTNQLTLTSDHKILCKMSEFYKTWKACKDWKDQFEAYSIRTIIDNYQDYFEGMFIGFLECEGSFKIRCNKKERTIAQKDEKKYLEFLLNLLKIKYSKWDDKKIKNLSYYYLKMENSEYIDSLYNKLNSSKSFQIGIVAGFLLGDGTICSSGKKHKDVLIVQKNKCSLLEKALNLSKIRYNKIKRNESATFSYWIHLFDLPLYAPKAKKAKKFQEMILGSSLLPFERKKIQIKQSKKQRVWDLTTTAGTFIANGFIVHNCREDWDEDTKEAKIAEYDGQSSVGYRLNVEAEIIEGAYGFWDLKRLKQKCFRQDRRIKYFEVSKDTFYNFESRLIVDRLPGSEQVYICSDIGSSASPSEVVILFYDGQKYKYHYQISLFKLTQKEQAKVFYWLYHKLGTAFIALDATNLDGGGIIDYLYDMGIPQEHLLKVRFNENIEVDFETDEEGHVQYDRAGNPIMKKVYTLDWAMQQLELLFYEGLIEIPIDEKFFKEFNGYIVKQTGMKKVYGSTTSDHLHQSFQCFAICRFFNQDNPLRNMKQKKRSFGVFNE